MLTVHENGMLFTEGREQRIGDPTKRRLGRMEALAAHWALLPGIRRQIDCG